MSAKKAPGGPEEILAALPHRSPFLMVDRVVERRGGHACLALKRVTSGDPGIRSGESGPHGTYRTRMAHSTSGALRLVNDHR